MGDGENERLATAAVGQDRAVKFNRRARLDPGQIQDRRGGGRGLPGGGVAIAGGGGVVGLILTVVLLLVNGGGGGELFDPGASQFDASEGEWSSDLQQECRTGEDAEEREDCRIVGVVNSVQSYWADAFAESGSRYREAQTQLFSGSTVSGCGQASSATGPFYCPADSTVYMDLSFFDVLTRPPFDAEGGPFAQAYVVAHEYGHHVQNLLGDLRGGREVGADSAAVRVELQADCYAGAWASNAVATGFIVEISDEDIRIGLDAAAAVGDDRIQEATRGRADPETFSHGTSAQRQEWFMRGYRSADPGTCDTFSGPI